MANKLDSSVYQHHVYINVQPQVPSMTMPQLNVTIPRVSNIVYGGLQQSVKITVRLSMFRQDHMSGGTYLQSLDRVRILSNIERVRHLYKTTDGSSVAGSSMTTGIGVPVVSY